MATFYPTQIQTYLQCPRKYFFGKDREIRAKYAKSTPYLVLGNAAHDALQAFFDVTKVKPPERTADRLHALFRDAWAGRGIFARNRWKQQEARTQAFAEDRETEAAWGKKGLDMLWRYVQTADLSAHPLTAEQFHEIWLTEHVTLGGKIDRIDRREDGSLEVLDYKTGKPPRTKWKAEPAPASGGGGAAPPVPAAPAPRAPAAGDAVRRSVRPLGEDDLQLAAYALLVTRKFRGKVARCTYVYLNDDLDLYFEPDEATLQAKEAEIVGVCDRILADREFGPQPTVLCGWCDYRPLCPEGEAFVTAHGAPAGGEADLPF